MGRNHTQIKQKLKDIQDCIEQNMSCNHPPDNGSDDYCDGEDCIHCYIIRTCEEILLDIEKMSRSHKILPMTRGSGINLRPITPRPNIRPVPTHKEQ